MNHRVLMAAALATDLVGASVARRHDLVGEPLRIRLPVQLPTPVELTVWGSAVSAPLLMDAALILGSPRLRRSLGGLRLVGTLA